MKDSRPTVLSLFSGVGGFDMGLESAGMRTVYQCEIDKHCRSVLDRHWPSVPRWSDISTLTGDEILSHAPEIDVVAWGSPCQDLSVAGKRAGLDGKKSSLFHEGIRVINEIRKATNGRYPRISIWENVYGALTSNKGADFRVILAEMAEAGAIFSEWRVLDARFFGIPQRRRRVFIISVFDTAVAERCADPILPIADSVRRHTETSSTQGQGTTTTTTDGIRADGAWDIEQEVVGALQAHLSKQASADDAAHGLLIPMRPVDDPLIIFENSYRDSVRISRNGITNTLPAQMGTGGLKTPMVAQPSSYATDDTTLAFDTQFGSNANVTENVSPTLKASQQAPSVAYGISGNAIGRQDHNGPNGPSHTPEGGPMFTLTSTDIHAVAQEEPTVFQPGTMIRLNGGVWEGTVPTLRAEAKRGDNEPHIHIHDAEPSMAVRRLTPLECERLMGWPDDHTKYKAEGTEQADSHRYKQCGNGVASPVAQWIGEQIVTHL